MTDLGTLGGTGSDANALSSDGAVVVGYSGSSLGQRAFVWDATTGMRALQGVLAAQGVELTGWTMTNASKATRVGNTIYVAGDGTRNSNTEAYRAAYDLNYTGPIHVAYLGGVISNANTGLTAQTPLMGTGDTVLISNPNATSGNVSLATSTTLAGLTMGATNGASIVAMNGNTLTLGNSAGATGTVSMGATGGALTLGSVVNNGLLTAGTGGASTLVLDNQHASNLLTVNTVIGDGASASVALDKTGVGTVVLAGQNTYTGLTTVSSGTLALDYTAGSNIIASGNALELAGGEVRFDNLGANSQTFTTTNLTSGTSSSLTRGVGWTSGVVNLGTLSSSGGGAALDVSDIAAAASWIRASGNLSQTSLLSGAVTANGGTNLVNTDASGYLVLGSVLATAVDYAGNATIPSSSGVDVRLISSGGVGSGATGSGFVGLSAAGTTDFKTLLNAYNGGNTTVDITNSGVNAGNILRLGVAGAVVSAAGGDLTLGVSVAQGGTLTAGGAPNTAGTLAFNSANTTTVNATIADNGGGAVALTKTGAGALVLNAANGYSGGTTLNQGVIEVNADSALGSGDTTVNGGTLRLNDVAYTGTATLNLHGDGTTSGAGALASTGTSSYAGAIVIASNATINNGGGTLTLTGGIDKTGTTVTFNGGGHTIISGPLGLWATPGVPDSDVVYSGPGTVVDIDAPSSYTGNTTVQNSATLRVNSTLDTTGTLLITSGGVLGGTNGTITQTGTVQVDNGSTITAGQLGTVSQLTIAGAANVNLHGTYQVDVDYGTGALGDESGDLLTLTGIGALDLSNATFTINELNPGELPAAGSHYYIKIFETNIANGGTAPNFELSDEAKARGQSVVTWDGGLTYYLVPEPASFSLLALGGAFLLLRRPSRRRGRKLRPMPGE